MPFNKIRPQSVGLCREQILYETSNMEIIRLSQRTFHFALPNLLTENAVRHFLAVSNLL